MFAHKSRPEAWPDVSEILKTNFDIATVLFSDNVFRLRCASGFSAKTLATFLGIFKNDVLAIENTGTPVSSDVEKKICLLFGVSGDDMKKQIITETTMTRIYSENKLSQEEMQAITNIVRLAENSEFMRNLLKNAAKTE